MNNSIIYKFYARSTFLPIVVLTCISNEAPCYQKCSYVNFLNNYRIDELHVFKQHFLVRKETKEKRFMLLAKLDSMTNPSVVKIVPHWPNLMGQIREQTFATLYATPPPLLLCSCSRDRSFRIDLLFCYVRDMAIPAVEFLNLERLLPENH